MRDQPPPRQSTNLIHSPSGDHSGSAIPALSKSTVGVASPVDLATMIETDPFRNCQKAIRLPSGDQEPPRSITSFVLVNRTGGPPESDEIQLNCSLLPPLPSAYSTRSA